MRNDINNMESAMKQHGYYTPYEAAKILNVHPRTVRIWIEKKTLPAFRVGGRWRILKKDVERMANPTGA